MHVTANEALTLARHYLEIGQPRRTLDLLSAPVSEDIEQDEFWFLRGQALAHLDRYGEAADAVRTGLARNPNSVGLLYLLSTVQAEQGDLAAAEEALLAALRIAPDMPDLLAHYAVLVARGGQFEKAERLLQRAAILDPENATLARSRTLCAYLRGDDKAMARASRDELARDPDDRYAHYLLGQALLEQRHLSEASRHITTAARLNPSDQTIVDTARSVRIGTHPLLWPIQPFLRLGTINVWLGFVVCFFGLQALGQNTAAAVLAVAYLTLCVYSWTVPPLLRWWLGRR